MSDIEGNIGKSIICSGLGIGEIIEIAPLFEGGEKFYKVSFPKERCTNYFSIENKNNYRFYTSRVACNLHHPYSKVLHQALDP